MGFGSYNFVPDKKHDFHASDLHMLWATSGGKSSFRKRWTIIFESQEIH